MEVTNEVLPTSSERIEQMMEPGPEGPIYMVNLLKFRDLAKYEDGRQTELSGRDAYQIYGRAVSSLIGEYGGAVVFAGMEGTRPLLVEVQALVAPSTLASPRRAVVGWDSARLAMVIAGLDARCGFCLLYTSDAADE